MLSITAEGVMSQGGLSWIVFVNLKSETKRPEGLKGCVSRLRRRPGCGLIVSLEEPKRRIDGTRSLRIDRSLQYIR